MLKSYHDGVRSCNITFFALARKEARSYRESVDYEDFLVITEEEAQKQHENASKLIEMIQMLSFINPPPVSARHARV